jgi:hypothetical protein
MTNKEKSLLQPVIDSLQKRINDNKNNAEAWKKILVHDFTFNFQIHSELIWKAEYISKNIELILHDVSQEPDDLNYIESYLERAKHKSEGRLIDYTPKKSTNQLAIVQDVWEKECERDLVCILRYLIKENRANANRYFGTGF